MSRQKKENYLFFLVLLFFAGLMIVGGAWRDHALFENAYKPAITDHRQGQQDRVAQDNGKPSPQPRPKGFNEKQINKQHGRRYATW